MWRYRVYLWINASSEAADIVQEVRAFCADTAIQKVMQQYRLSYVSYAWVVPFNERVPCTDRTAVLCHVASYG